MGLLYLFTSTLVERVVGSVDGNISETRTAVFWIIMQRWKPEITYLLKNIIRKNF
jgi:hypothetical protein